MDINIFSSIQHPDLTTLSNLIREQEQIAECDICSKWRRIPVNALLPANWTCAGNIWDSNRSATLEIHVFFYYK